MQFGLSYVLGVFLIVYCISPVEAGLKDEIEKLLEEFRVRMCHPFPQWGLPALDPFEIKHEEIYVDNNIFKNFSASITDLKATGLSGFKVNEIKITALTRKFLFDLTFSLDELQSLYTAKGSLGNVVNLVGDDKINGHLKEVRIIVSGGIKIGFTFGIKNLKIKFAIGELFVDMGKLMEHERINNFFRNLINDLTIELLGDFWEDYGDALTAQVEKTINKKMSSFTLKEVIGIISGSGQPIFGDNPPGDCENHVEFEPNVVLYKNN